jgi:hypothetical protein
MEKQLEDRAACCGQTPQEAQGYSAITLHDGALRLADVMLNIGLHGRVKLELKYHGSAYANPVELSAKDWYRVLRDNARHALVQEIDACADESGPYFLIIAEVQLSETREDAQ